MSHRNTASNAGRGKTFPPDEVTLMLNIIRALVPLGMLHWDTVADQFNAGQPPERIRDADSLKAKFKNLKNTRKPTGDP